MRLFLPAALAITCGVGAFFATHTSSSSVILRSQAENLFGGQDQPCIFTTIIQACTNTTDCIASYPNCNGDCSLACNAGGSNDTLCSQPTSGNTLATCKTTWLNGGCGVFYDSGVTCSVHVTTCQCNIMNGVPGNEPCEQGASGGIGNCIKN